MSAFFKPETIKITEIPTILYPCEGLEKVISRFQKNAIKDHLQKIHLLHTSIASTGEYHITILWNDKDDVMTDLWIFDQLESWGSGPLVDVKIFRNFALEATSGVSAGDGLIMLGKEEEHRRSRIDLHDYLYGKRPQLIDGMVNGSYFYQNK